MHKAKQGETKGLTRLPPRFQEDGGFYDSAKRLDRAFNFDWETNMSNIKRIWAFRKQGANIDAAREALRPGFRVLRAAFRAAWDEGESLLLAVLSRGSPVISLESARLSTPSRERCLTRDILENGTESSPPVEFSRRSVDTVFLVTEFKIARNTLQKGEVMLNPHVSHPGSARTPRSGRRTSRVSRASSRAASWRSGGTRASSTCKTPTGPPW